MPMVDLTVLRLRNLAARFDIGRGDERREELRFDQR
jgi:hypothetical protein